MSMIPEANEEDTKAVFACSEFAITSPEGLHLRPAAMLMSTASRFDCDVTVHYNGVSADAKSIMHLVTLNAVCGSCVTVHTEGHDAEEAIEAIGDLFANDFRCEACRKTDGQDPCSCSV